MSTKNKQLKIAFVGRAGSGKTTISNAIANKRYNAVIMSFATPLKRIAEEILLRPIVKTDPLDRKFLQQLGTDVCRARQEDIWIKHFDKAFNGSNIDHNGTPCKMALVSPGLYTLVPFAECNFFVDDCRFPDEAEYLKKNGFTIIKLTGRHADITSDNAAHKSEAGQDRIIPDYVIDNGGSIEDTVKQIEALGL